MTSTTMTLQRSAHVKHRSAITMFITPFLALFACFYLVPIGYAVYQSFRTVGREGTFGAPVEQFGGLTQYRRVFTDEAFWDSVWRVLGYGAVQVPVMLGLALVFALLEGEAGAGLDDHGGAWSRPWTQVDADTCEVTVEGLSLRRRIEVGPTITAHYTVVGAPGRSFVWAWHALIDPHPGMQVRADPGPVLDWPDGVDHLPRHGIWPQVGGEPQFDVCAPNDATARFALLPDRCRVEVGDDLSALVLTLAPDPSSPEVATSIGIWRNLGGYAWDGGPPYRSLGVEPMLGRSPRADGPRADVVTIPASGRVSWTLTISSQLRGIGPGPTPVRDR